MRAKRRQFPEGREARVRLDRVSLVGIKGVCAQRSIRMVRTREKEGKERTILDRCVIGFRAVDHGHAARVEFEHVVDEGDDGDDSCGRSREGEACEALDEGGDEGGGKVAANFVKSAPAK